MSSSLASIASWVSRASGKIEGVHPQRGCLGPLDKSNCSGSWRLRDLCSQAIMVSVSHAILVHRCPVFGSLPTGDPKEFFLSHAEDFCAVEAGRLQPLLPQKPFVSWTHRRLCTLIREAQEEPAPNALNSSGKRLNGWVRTPTSGSISSVMPPKNGWFPLGVPSKPTKNGYPPNATIGFGLASQPRKRLLYSGATRRIRSAGFGPCLHLPGSILVLDF